MPSIPRNTRITLIETLYADISVKSLDLQLFQESYQDEVGSRNINENLFNFLRSYIHQNSQTLLSIIVALAPRFDIEKMPRVHIIILFVALSELLSTDTDAKIIINEAIEVAKIFSDEAGARFVNGTLSTFIKNKDAFLNLKPSSYQFFI